MELFRLNFGEVITISIGDSENDEGMLATVDIPMLVQRADNRWNKLKIRNLQRVKGVGPEGWSNAVEKLLVESLL
jgi:predicted mannosyl-3-phosphoglycerate phosphatase (HAD superfamily)